MMDAADPAYDLCLKADPYWISRINSYVLPVRLVGHLAGPYREAAVTAVKALSREDFDAAAQAAAAARAMGIEDAGFAVHLAGLAAAGRGRFDEAIPLIELSLSEAACAEYRNNAGVAYVKAGRIAAAVAQFEAATRLAPDFGPPFAALAMLYTLARRWPQAEASARRAGRLKAPLGDGLVDLCLLSARLEQGQAPEGAFEFASLALDAEREIDAALASLPPVAPAEFRHEATGRYTVFLACDKIYFWRHGVPFVWSMAEVRPDCSLHVHIGNADEEVRAALAAMRARIAPLPLTASFETVDVVRQYEKANYFSAARYCRLYQFLMANRRPTVMLDADVLWRRDIWPALAAAGPADVCLCRLEAQPPWARLVGRFIFARPTAGTEAFLRRLALFVADNFRKNAARWFLDQIGLYAVHRAAGDGVRFAYVPESEVSDRRFTDESALWTVTNELKQQDNRYNAYKMELLAKYGDPRRP